MNVGRTPRRRNSDLWQGKRSPARADAFPCNPQLFCFRNSPAERALGLLPRRLRFIALERSDALARTNLTGILVADASNGEMFLARRLRGSSRHLQTVVLAAPEEIAGIASDQVYACLPKDIPGAILERTLENALAHLRLAWEQEQAALELNELNAIGVRLSAERDSDTLLDLILTKAREITRSDAGSIYLVEEGEGGTRRLRFRLAQNDSVEVPFREFTLPISEESVAGYVALTGKVLNLEDAYNLPTLNPFRINEAFDLRAGYRSKSMLVVPMRTPEGETIGVLQLINCKRDARRALPDTLQVERHTIPFPSRFCDLAASLASQAAVAFINRRLDESIRNLFEGFVKASVTAIETRDPTTAGHSFRVADLSLRLAEAVSAAESGPYAAVRFSPEEIKELRYAAILHDFGKVGVKEEVLAKAKKLYPGQLELIELRGELIKRGIELRASRARLERQASSCRASAEACAPEPDDETAALLARVDDCLEAIRALNEPAAGGLEAAEQVRRIARLGFADEQGRIRSLLTPREEMYLLIPRGTLTEEERRQIESHVSHSRNFLSQIPWTRDLKRIPEYAGSHHERLNGYGYPERRSAGSIPLQSRILMIADVYDALTASDRSYKKAMPAARAFEILREEAARGALDADLVEIFIRERVHISVDSTARCGRLRG